jgi:hypothetical protein
MQFGWIGQTAQVATGRGVRVERLLLDAGIAASEGRVVPETWLDPGEYMLMCALLINAVDDEMHATTRSRMRRGTASMGVKLVSSAKTFGEAITRLLRFYDMAGGFCAVSLRRAPAVVVIEIRADDGAPEMTAMAEELMATHLHALFSHYLGFLLPLQGFVTRARQHPNLGATHPYLRCGVQFGATTSLTFSQAYLSLGLRDDIFGASLFEAMHFWVRQFDGAESFKAKLEATSPLSAQVYAMLVEDDLAFATCCARLAMSERDTRQALFAEGRSYRDLRRSALMARVRPHLDAHANADDMAFALGYSDARSLRRALKLAGGLSLSDARSGAASWASHASGPVIHAMRRHMEHME